MRPWS
ncbi:Protein of unknown function [Escherichia coli]